MIIVSGYLLVDPAQRDAYLAATFEVARLARVAPGCLDFVQVADPLEDDRIVIYERWESDEQLTAFRNSGTGGDAGNADDTSDLPPELLAAKAAKVAKYRISAVESP